MRETFPVKKRGDRLEASHVNKLSSVCRRMGLTLAGPNVEASSGTTDSIRVASPFVLEQLIITEDNGDGTYRIKFRYYNHGINVSPEDTSEIGWKTLDTETDYILDATESGLAFNVDDKVIAYWHNQRNAFMPFGSAGIIMKIGKADSIITPGAKDAVISLWEENSDGELEDTEENQEDVRHDWVTGNQNIQSGTEVIIGYFANESLWRIIGADCPT